MKKRNCYIYKGPVFHFGKMIVPEWFGQTYASSEAKARANLTYRFKCQAGFLPSSKIELPGKVVLIF